MHCWLVLLLLLTPISSVFADASTDLKTVSMETISQRVEAAFKEANVPGLAFSLFDAKQMLLQKNFGYINKAERVEVMPDSLFRQGSLTMLVTGLLTLKFVELGLLDLDTPIRYYLDDNYRLLKNSIGDRNLRQLLSHHSGLPLNYYKDSWAEQPSSYKFLLLQNQNLKPVYPANTIFSYSNIGYTVVAAVIESVSKRSYEENIRTYLFEPLDIKQAYFDIKQLPKTNLARPYKKGDVQKLLDVRDKPALGLISTMEEMVKVVQLLMHRGRYNGQQIIAAELIDEMFKNQNEHIPMDLDRRVGLSWRFQRTPFEDLNTAVMYGATLFFKAHIMLIREYNIAMLVFANDQSSWELLETIRNTVVEEYANTYQHKKRELTPQLSLQENPFKLQPYYSSYVGLLALDLKAQPNEVDVMGWDFQLIKDEKSWFAVQYDLFGFIPLKLDWITKVHFAPYEIMQQPILLSYYHGQRYVFATALSESKSPSAAWQQRLGEYQLANPDALTELMKIEEGELLLEKSRLVFKYRLPGLIPLTLKIPLEIIDDNHAYLPGLGSGLNEKILVEKRDDEELLNFSGYLLQKTPSLF